MRISTEIAEIKRVSLKYTTGFKYRPNKTKMKSILLNIGIENFMNFSTRTSPFEFVCLLVARI